MFSFLLTTSRVFENFFWFFWFFWCQVRVWRNWEHWWIYSAQFWMAFTRFAPNQRGQNAWTNWNFWILNFYLSIAHIKNFEMAGSWLDVRLAFNLNRSGQCIFQLKKRRTLKKVGLKRGKKPFWFVFIDALRKKKFDADIWELVMCLCFNTVRAGSLISKWQIISVRGGDK